MKNKTNKKDWACMGHWRDVVYCWAAIITLLFPVLHRRGDVFIHFRLTQYYHSLKLCAHTHTVLSLSLCPSIPLKRGAVVSLSVYYMCACVYVCAFIMVNITVTGQMEKKKDKFLCYKLFAGLSATLQGLHSWLDEKFVLWMDSQQTLN